MSSDGNGFFVDMNASGTQSNQFSSSSIYPPTTIPPLSQHSIQNQPSYEFGMHQNAPLSQPMLNPSDFQGTLVANAMSLAAQQQIGDVSQKMQGLLNVGQLKYYFDVDNRYVAKKLQLILCPFFQREWSRGVKDEKFMTPREDKRAPDLYIPVMALVTYMLLLSYIQGATGKFTARHLSVLCSSTIGLLLFETLVGKLGSFLTGVQVPIYELVAWASYKFVSIIFVILVTLLARSMGFYVALTWAGISLFYFTASVQSPKSMMFSLVVAALQALLLIFLATAGIDGISGGVTNTSHSKDVGSENKG